MEKTVAKTCNHCNKKLVQGLKESNYRFNKLRRFCNYSCSRKSRIRGFWYDKDGYLMKTVLGKKIKIHREVVEIYLGRNLSSNEIVHHINENKLDNRIENLTIMSKSEHQSYHANKAKRNKYGQFYCN